MGRLNREEVNVEIDEIEIFKNEEYQGFKLKWVGNIGFGEYTIYQNVDDPEKWKADSECMDYPDDKWFLKKLLQSFEKQLEITG